MTFNGPLPYLHERPATTPPVASPTSLLTLPPLLFLLHWQLRLTCGSPQQVAMLERGVQKGLRQIMVFIVGLVRRRPELQQVVALTADQLEDLRQADLYLDGVAQVSGELAQAAGDGLALSTRQNIAIEQAGTQQDTFPGDWDLLDCLTVESKVVRAASESLRQARSILDVRRLTADERPAQELLQVQSLASRFQTDARCASLTFTGAMMCVVDSVRTSLRERIADPGAMPDLMDGLRADLAVLEGFWRFRLDFDS